MTNISTLQKRSTVLEKVAHLPTVKALEKCEQRGNWRTALVACRWLVYLGCSTLQQTSGNQISVKHPVVLELNVTSLVHIKPEQLLRNTILMRRSFLSFLNTCEVQRAYMVHPRDSKVTFSLLWGVAASGTAVTAMLGHLT